MMKDIIKDLIFYGSYLVVPLCFLLWNQRKKFSRMSFVFVWGILLLFIYTRFIEPQMIITRHQAINTGFSAKIILISDLHLGRYKGQKFLQRVVHTINEIPGDAVFIAGDLTYEPKKNELKTLFQPLSKLNKPVYWVLGNHDVEKPGPKLREELVEALKYDHIHFLNNDVVDMGDFTLIGL